MYVIRRQDTTGLFIVVDTDTGRTIARAELPQNAISLAIQAGMPAENREALLAEAQVIVNQENAGQPPPPETASQTAQDDAPQGPSKPAEQVVNANGRVVTAPPVTPSTNADSVATQATGDVDTGTDAPTRTIEQTQATNGYDGTTGINIRSEDGTLSSLRRNPESGELYDASGIPGGVELKTEPGQGAPSEDAGEPTAQTTQDESKAARNTIIKVVPQPNVLDKFASYSYVASVYLVTDVQYKRLLTSQSKKIDGYQLLFQSGGAPNNVGGVRQPPPAPVELTENDGTKSSYTPESPTYPDGGRNPFFDTDFYIDSITLDTSPIGKGSGAAHMTAGLKFTVIEPMGITLIDRLYDAVQNASQKDEQGRPVNYTAATYLMVIRFYGYDEDGNQVVPIKGSIIDEDGKSDPLAVVEKFIPFQVASINWSVGSKLVTYEWDCVPQGQIVGGYSARGTIPFDVQLVDSTVGGLLSGDAKYAAAATPADNPGKSTTTNAGAGRGSSNDPRRTDAASTQAPSKANAAPTDKKTVTQGLMGAMNDFQAELVKKGVYEVADEYSIEFLGIEGVGAEKIRDAKLQLPNTKIDKAKTAAGKPATEDPKGVDPKRQQVDSVSRSFSLVAGQQLLQAIELAIRNSAYITDQSLVIVNPDGTQQPNPNASGKPMTWFSISMTAEPIKYDYLRNDKAYKIKYTVAPFIVKNFNSKYFPVSKFSGVHKSYPYWFTGKNTAVLDYSETLNALYSLTVSGGDSKNSLAAETRKRVTSSMRDIIKYNYDPRSTQSSQGADGKSYEPNANAAEILYSPGDLAETKVKILGDPAWIQQGSLFKDVTDATFKGDVVSSGFNPDGSIAFDTQDILFEVVWQRPEDYDLVTGVADPYSRTQKNAAYKREPIQSRVYYCTKVLSEFRNGRFEQTLHGSLYLFPKQDGSNTADAAAAASSSSEAEAELLRESRRGTANAGATTTNAKPPARPGTSDAGAGRGTSQFSATDPRRLDIGDGGKAAVVGAQQAQVSGAREFSSNGGGAAFGNPNLTRQGVRGNAQLAPAGSPGNPTTGAATGSAAGGSTGENITEVNTTVASGPPKLPGRPIAPGSLRDIQRQRQLQADGNPGSTTQPQNQQIVKER